MDKKTDNSDNKLLTVLGPINKNEVGITDAHNHVWIDSVEGVNTDAPILDNKEKILSELIDFRANSGSAIVDCQPGGAGRNANKLYELSKLSGVHIIASTGFHLKRYYPPDFWLFGKTVDEASKFFLQELQNCIVESQHFHLIIRSGLIKIAFEETLNRSPMHLVEAAVVASLETGAAIEVHTEKGAAAEKIYKSLFGFGMPAEKIILCHLDKKADFELHKALAEEGILLEYDTFFREKYHPDKNVWSLLETMVVNGLDNKVAIATDMADTKMWKSYGGLPGLTGLQKNILPQMQRMGFDAVTIKKLIGENIVERLARPIVENKLGEVE
jgi:5-phospho-D-xylono-1,4-lactonase